jgi:predicted SAM-dependent methyltransferase
MKIQILTNESNKIEGIETIMIHDMDEGLSSYSDNECELILANEILDYVPLNMITECLKKIIRKLRLNGKLVVGGTDVRIFSRNIINNMISEQEASKMIGAKASMSSLITVAKLLQSFGLQVKSSNISGVHYEVVAVRTQ